jgi:hypothetical protein
MDFDKLFEKELIILETNKEFINSKSQKDFDKRF